MFSLEYTYKCQTKMVFPSKICLKWKRKQIGLNSIIQLAPLQVIINGVMIVIMVKTDHGIMDPYSKRQKVTCRKRIWSIITNLKQSTSLNPDRMMRKIG